MSTSHQPLLANPIDTFRGDRQLIRGPDGEVCDHQWRYWEPPAHGETFWNWSGNRCAMCGDCYATVTDHCHMTGLIRGRLCTSCNIREARSDHGRWQAWRDGENPAFRHGFAVVYYSPFSGTVLSPHSKLLLLTPEKRQEWWDEQAHRASMGQPWPTEVRPTAEDWDRWEEQSRRHQDVNNVGGTDRLLPHTSWI
ncbi:hypothetical protein GCG21_08655 [Pseudactinotalea sp. HY160]|uniref:endonuclease domain-containing protein n=1 Tax=Pseudactinotalea sp. HY160 TaxID=2654490 RepID=UPI00128D66CB|nr:hypothetical protein [Pseudactinotalea sp. HY160]